MREGDDDIFSMSNRTMPSSKGKEDLEYLEKRRKFISIKPYGEFSCPNLGDDYYHNILDWSKQNVVGIGVKRKIIFLNPISLTLQKTVLEIPQNIFVDSTRRRR